VIATETFERLDFARIRTILSEKCATVRGKRQAEALAPCRGVEQARRRFAETEEALRFPHTLPFGLCAPGDELLVKLEKEAYLSPLECLKLAQVLEGLERIARLLASAKREEFPLLRETGDMLATFDDLRMQITSTVDEEGVKESASPRLGELRRAMAAARKEVLAALEACVASGKEIFQDSPIHFREGRLVLAVRRDREAEFEGIVHGISSGGATVFVEPLETVAVNNRLRRLRDEEREEVERVLRALADAVRERLSDIRASLDVVAELDFIFARADWAGRFKAAAVDPAGDRLGILAARHPLLELKREVVPLDLEFDPETKVLLVSGPNAGGKTVVLKTVGLSALLSSSGLHVPASRDTRIPFFRKVFIDIGDEQSIDDDLSSFTAHLANLRRILRDADAESLVLLDELGASTSPEEGGALGMAVLSALLRKGATVIATTHLESLKYFVEENPSMQNAGMEFTDHPTYRLIVGIPGTSNALEVADEVGFPSQVIDEARSFLRPELLESSALIAKLSEEHRKAEELREGLEESLKETAEAKARCEREWAELAERRRRFDAEMIAEREMLLSEARREIENLVREIKETQASRSSILKAKEFANAQGSLRVDQEETESRTAPGLAEGLRVSSRQLKREGVIAEINERSGEALVEFGTLKMARPLSDLSPVEGESPERSSLRSPRSEVAEGAAFEPRLHLLGMHVDEAYDRLLIHISEALALGVEEVAIVHGKGTGVLRGMVMEFARRDRRVSSFRVGEPFEGGDGVTVLRLAS
jgi:DNA mismatch repair protein MutS2